MRVLGGNEQRIAQGRRQNVKAVDDYIRVLQNAALRQANQHIAPHTLGVREISAQGFFIRRHHLRHIA